MKIKVSKYRGQPPEPGEKFYEHIMNDEFMEFCALLKETNKTKSFHYHHGAIMATACKDEVWPLPQKKYDIIIKYVDEFLKIKPTIQLIAFLIAHGKSQRAIAYLENNPHFQKYEFILMAASCDGKNLEVFNYLEKQTLKNKVSKNLLINTALQYNFPYEWLDKQSLEPVFIIETLLNEITNNKVNMQGYLRLLNNTFSNMSSFHEMIADYCEQVLQAKQKMKKSLSFGVKYPEEVIWKQNFYHQYSFIFNDVMIAFNGSEKKKLANKIYLKMILENALKEKVAEVRGYKI